MLNHYPTENEILYAVPEDPDGTLENGLYQIKAVNCTPKINNPETTYKFNASIDISCTLMFTLNDDKPDYFLANATPHKPSSFELFNSIDEARLRIDESVKERENRYADLPGLLKEKLHNGGISEIQANMIMRILKQGG